MSIATCEGATSFKRGLTTTIWVILLAPLLVLTSRASAQDENCVDLIRLSRTIAREVGSESRFMSTVNNFCDEYHRSIQTSSSGGFGAKYKLLKLSSSSTQSQIDSTASKYCEANSAESRDDLSYDHYLEETSPEALQAYRECVNQNRTGITFRLQTYAPEALTLLAHYNTDVGTPTKLSYYTRDPVNCRWQEQGRPIENPWVELSHGEQKLLECTRRPNRTPSDPRNSDYIDVTREGGGTGNINIPWVQFDENADPYPTLAQIKNSLDAQTRDLEWRLVENEGQTMELQEQLDESRHQFANLQNTLRFDLIRINRAAADQRNRRLECEEEWVDTNVTFSYAWGEGNNRVDYKLCMKIVDD